MIAFANVNGESVVSANVHFPNVGPWWANVFFEAAPDFSDGERVTFNVGPLALSATVDAKSNGVFGAQRKMRVIGGAGGWSDQITAQHYHNDAGVLALSVANDAARLVGESIGTFEPSAPKVGVDYVRQTGPAARALEDVIGGAAWWVDPSGQTIVGTRSERDTDASDYEVLEYSPALNVATLAIDDLTKVGIGSVFTEGLEAPLTAFELEVTISPEEMRVRAWGGGEAARRGRLASNLVSIVEAVTRRRLFGKYRYRFVRMSGDRVELQAVSSAPGLPDVLPVSQNPGVAGAHADLFGGTIVYVEFVEGDRTMPIVVGFAGKGEGGHAPNELVLSVVSLLRLGGDGAIQPVALAPSIDSQLDAINAALDAFAATLPVTSDGGAALQTAFKAQWGSGLPPKPASNVGASKVVAE